MGKILLALLTVLALLSGGLLAGAQAGLYQASDDVTIQETVLLGDPEAAAGLELSAAYRCKDYLNWDSRFPVGHTDQLETQFRFRFEDEDRDFGYVRDGNIYITEPWNYSSTYLDEPVEDEDGSWSRWHPETHLIRPVIEAVLDKVPEDGSPYTETFPLDQYFTYLPLYFYTWGYAYDDASHLMSDYFRIPVPPDLMMELSISKTASDRYYDVCFNMVDKSLYLDTRSVQLDDEGLDVLFTIIVGETTVPLDDSFIPGGWGIYRLTNTKQEDGSVDPALATLTTVYSVPEGETILDFWAPEDKSSLFLLTHGADDMLRLTVLDWESVTPVQTLELLPYSQELGLESGDPYLGWVPLHLNDYYQGEDFLVISTYYWNYAEIDWATVQESAEEWAQPHLILLTLEEDGSWQERFTVNTWLAQQVRGNTYRNQAHMAFDGTRLAIVDNSGSLSVWDETGLLYMSRYDHSLGRANTPAAVSDVQQAYTQPWKVAWQ